MTNGLVPALHPRANAYARVVAALSVALGAVVLAGWAFDVPVLTRGGAAWPTMKANTALAFALLGLSLGALAATGPDDERPSTPVAAVVARYGGVLVALLGALTLAEYLFNWNPGIDTWLFSEAATGASSNHPGRMAPETALSLVLLGLALAIRGISAVRDWLTVTCAALAVAAIAIGLAGFTALATPSFGMEGWLGATGTSAFSALLSVLVGTAIIALHWRRNPRIWALGVRTTLAFGAGLVLLVLGGLFASRLQYQLQRRAAEMSALERSRFALQALLQNSVQSQAAVTAFVSFGDRAMLAQFRTARAGADSSLRALRDFSVAWPLLAHDEHLTTIDSLLRAQRRWQDRALAAFRPTLPPAARRALVHDGMAMIPVRTRELSRMEAEHAAIIDAVQAQTVADESRAYTVISASTVAGMTFFLLALLGLNRTERRRQRAEEQARESEWRWRFAIEGSGDGLWDWDVPSSTVFFSHRWKQMLGHGDDEIGTGLDEWSSRVHPDDLAGTLAAVQEHLDGKTPSYVSEHRVRCKDGTYKWILDRGLLVRRDADGAPLRAIGTHTDVTERHVMQQALLESEGRYRTLVEMSPAAIVVHSGGRIVFVNPATLRLTHATSADQLIGRAVMDLVHPDSRAVVMERMRRGMELGMDAPLIEERFIRLDGTAVDVETVARPVVFAGQPAMLVSSHDITARKLAGRQLEVSEERFRTIFEEAPLGVAVVDSLTGQWIDVNRRYEQITGRTRDELRQLDWMRITHPDDIQADLDNMALLNAGKIAGFGMIKRMVRPDGSVVWGKLTVARMSPDADGRRRHVAMMEDITERRREEETRTALEAQLQASQRMESVGRLAGGVAHDFNNMLGVILGTAELALQQVEPDSALHDELREIQGAARRSAELTRQLLAFARRQIVAPTVLDINDAVSGALRMLERLIGEDVRLEWTPGSALWQTKIDPSQLDQVLTNLCLNARHAIDDVGTITISTSNRSLDDAFCAGHPEATRGDYVCLTVRDTGSGIAPEVLAHIFEPFYTTKSLGEGTGLGLATVYGAVRQNGGFIAVQSAVGAGATFDVYLPRHVGAASEARRSGQFTAAVAGHETILVVEDEPAILRLTTRMLQSQGYQVLGTTNPHDAIRHVSERSCDIDLLLTDVVMPGMNGRELATTLAPICPTLRVLFMSGHTADVMAKRGVMDGGTFFVEKPFTIAVLTHKVREALDAPPYAAGGSLVERSPGPG